MPDSQFSIVPPQRSSTGRQTISERIPGFWTFAGLGVLFVAICLWPLLLKQWHLEASTEAVRSTPPAASQPIEQMLMAKLRQRAYSQGERPVREPPRK